MQEYQMFINGQWLESGSNKFLESVNPSTGEVITHIPKGEISDVQKAISAARDTFDNSDWPKMPYLERAEYLKKISQLIREQAYALAQLETIDTGKTIKQTTFIDIPMAAAAFEYFADAAPSELKGQIIPLALPAHSQTVYEPVGVVAAIIPWNYPFLMAAWKIAPALACGNTVVFKPSHLASLSSLELAKIIEKAGVPGGVVNVVTGKGEDIGAELAANPQVDMVAFTGSTEVGKKIMQLAASNTKKIFLELGGKSPNIVFSDADLDAAVSGALAAIFMNQGQMCVAGSRLLLEKKIYKEFLDRLVERTKKLKIGNSINADTDFGPLISEEQRKKVLDYIQIGRKEGAKMLCGGGVPKSENLEKGFYLEPTIFNQVNNKMRIAQEEIFGPVLCVMEFSTVEEAVKIANDTKYGLAAMIWTKDIHKANLVAQKIRAGTIWINTFGGFYNEAPFGGYKESGIGRECGREGLLEYTQLKHINLDLNPSGKSLVCNWF